MALVLQNLLIGENFVGFEGYNVFCYSNNFNNIEFMGADEEDFSINIFSFVATNWKKIVDF